MIGNNDNHNKANVNGIIKTNPKTETEDIDKPPHTTLFKKTKNEMNHENGNQLK